MPTPFDWTPIFGIEFRFTGARNPTAAASLNKAYSEIIDIDELSELFLTRDAKEDKGPLEIAPDPQLHILNCIAKTIAINLMDPDEVTKGHIANLLSKCVVKHVRNNGSRKQLRYKTEFDAAAKHTIRTNTDEEPIVLFELTITHWLFKTNGALTSSCKPTPETHHLPPHPGPNLPIYYSANIPHRRPLPQTLPSWPLSHPLKPRLSTRLFLMILPKWLIPMLLRPLSKLSQRRQLPSDGHLILTVNLWCSTTCQHQFPYPSLLALLHCNPNGPKLTATRFHSPFHIRCCLRNYHPLRSPPDRCEPANHEIRPTVLYS
eukprot:jgi/Psemu1/52676/gm1.52676_g